MKNITAFDILFIIITTGLFTLIIYFGYSELLSRFSFMVALIAYFAGKYIGRAEQKKKLNEG